MALKPWYKVITPREDLREGKPLDAAEFAVHLDQVREGRAPDVYQNPQQFFERTYLTRNLSILATEVMRRLSGQTTDASAVFNLATQFGGGKTHSLTLLYHLAHMGPEAHHMPGVKHLLESANLATVPRAETAVFVGTEFDSISGRGGDDGTPKRMTPWGEIAWSLGGEAGFRCVAEHDAQGDAPGGDVIRRFIPQDKPCLILLDELMNYVSRSRRTGMADQFYNFLQNLSEFARSVKNIVLVVSIPASELEMTAEDQSDYERFKHLLNRLGKAIVMSAETETSEIIRRRLFEWEDLGVNHEGRPIVALPKEARETCKAYAEVIMRNRTQLPEWFDVDHAQKVFEATYPFHPLVLSVFERKWQALPRFQQTRGMLRLLALWVSQAYVQGFKGAHKDQLIGLGTAPLEDSLFRAALFEQLGEHRLEAAVTTDIKGKTDAHSLRLDEGSDNTEIRKGRLHQKTATTIFFESNGGQTQHRATRPEIMLSLVEPEGDIGHMETLLDNLSESCYYLTVEKSQYRFSLHPNLNKLLADRRASVQPETIAQLVKTEIQKVFNQGSGVERVYFPDKSGQIPDRASLALVVVSPEQSQSISQLDDWIQSMIRESGNSSRTYKSGLIWCVPDSSAGLSDEARRLLAWQAIQDEELRLDETQQRQLSENIAKAKRDLTESVWRTYRNLKYLNKRNELQTTDLGLVHSSSAKNIVHLILERLKQDGELTETVSANLLLRNWPPAFKEWNTRSVRDAFYASPVFPRLQQADAIRQTIAQGVYQGQIAYVGDLMDGKYQPFHYKEQLSVSDVEISEDMFIISRETAEAYLESLKRPEPAPTPHPIVENPSTSSGAAHAEKESSGSGGSGNIAKPITQLTKVEPLPLTRPTHLSWSGKIEPPHKWMTFYTKMLTKLVSKPGLHLTVNVDLTMAEGISEDLIEELKTALQEMDMDSDIRLD